MIQDELGDAQWKLNSKKKTKQGELLNVGTRGLTSEEGLCLWEIEKAQRAEKEKEKSEATARKKARDAATLAVCEASSTGGVDGECTQQH
ncbi:hypothetical protein PAXRUDRAFT_20257 [Paxillus rubicundulus Ve08.2h10]|uniref:Unplaced genomic scaffold scaffold_4379, whole genome shotgun sequence n=1 Tax=Paxillus rubicundulus Ve08.2h10 TaxID=930991 RepID=A0A0D0D2E6_9AGAM|nr:hypothetical protein PAXRUDRAFT_20257 [Paxillus rubicundulus Ve08.2h10]